MNALNEHSIVSSTSPLLSGEQEQEQEQPQLPTSQTAAAAAAAGSKKRKTTEGNATEGDESDNGEENHVNIDADNSTNNIIDNNNNNNGQSSGSGRVGNQTSVTIPISTLHQHLICSLCRGYFRDPYTISDCLHTFCRSCLVMYFRKGSIDICCPTCNTRLGADPFHTSIINTTQEILPDRRLQEIVSKIFPHLKAIDDEAERRFYAQRGIGLKEEYVAMVHQAKKSRGGCRVGGEDSKAMGGDDQLDLKFQPDESPPQLYHRLPSLRCSNLRLSGKAKIASLKKYLVMKLGLKDSMSSVEVLCNGEVMGDDLSLAFINNSRWLSTNNATLVLKYRLEERSDVIANDP